MGFRVAMGFKKMYTCPMTKLVPVILSGGVGSRLWPVSRSKRPKPFMWIEHEGSLLDRTFARLGGLNPDCVISVTNTEYRFATANVASRFDFPHSMILEPFARNTAGAIGVAAQHVAHQFGDDAMMVVLPSDHIIKDTDTFTQTIKTAITVAEQGKLVTLGIQPHKPHTGYGYIQSGDVIDGGFLVQKFVEKPDLKTAQSYVDDGGYYWNAGMFVFTAQNYLQALQTNAPDVASVVGRIDVTANDGIIDKSIFNDMPDISIDYAVMEKSENVAVVPAHFDWNDLGSWDSVAETLPTDDNHNTIRGQAFLHNSKNTTVFSTSEDKVIATVGLEDITIVETRDAVLVANSNDLQGVKDVVNHLTDINHDVVHVHRTEYRPWGTFTILDESEYHKAKQIVVYPHQKLSLQSHNHRSEHWIIVKGQATITNGDDIMTLNANQSTYIPQGNMHRLENKTDKDVVMIEVQTGDYFGEDDIERYTDDYGRE